MKLLMGAKYQVGPHIRSGKKSERVGDGINQTEVALSFKKNTNDAVRLFASDV